MIVEIVEEPRSRGQISCRLERVRLPCKGRRSSTNVNLEDFEMSILATADVNVAFSLGEE